MHKLNNLYFLNLPDYDHVQMCQFSRINLQGLIHTKRFFFSRIKSIRIILSTLNSLGVLYKVKKNDQSSAKGPPSFRSQNFTLVYYQPKGFRMFFLPVEITAVIVTTTASM